MHLTKEIYMAGECGPCSPLRLIDMALDDDDELNKTV